MVVELNEAFVPDRLKNRVIHHLRQSWARTRIQPPALRVRWAQDDPGRLVMAIELETTRVVPHIAVTGSAKQILELMDELEETLANFLRANGN
jgi:hypothetical protein